MKNIDIKLPTKSSIFFNVCRLHSNGYFFVSDIICVSLFPSLTRSLSILLAFSKKTSGFVDTVLYVSLSYSSRSHNFPGLNCCTFSNFFKDV